MDVFKEYNIQFTDAQAICEASVYDEKTMEKAYKLLKIQKKQIDNVVGWIIACVKGKYEVLEKPKEYPKNNFNNFTQRENIGDEYEIMGLFNNGTPIIDNEKNRNILNKYNACFKSEDGKLIPN